MKSINKHQLFSLMIIFEIGSTTLNALGIKAKQDAWIVILVSMFIALFFAWIHTELYKLFPKNNYIEIINSILGRWLGIPLSLLYAVLWLWATTRNFREFGELILLTYLPQTPLSVVMFLFLLTGIYVISLGIQVFARTSEIIMPLLISFIISAFIMIALSGYVNFKNLTPILGGGITPILKESFPSTSIFPYNIIFIFSMYWCFVDDKDAIRKTTMKAIIFSGMLLSLTSIIYISVLGVEYASISTIPFIVIIKMINVGEFLTNLDAIGISVMFLGGFYKVCLYLNGLTLVIATVFRIKNHNLLLLFTSLFSFWIAIVFESSYTYHRWMSPFDLIYFYPAFLYVIPTLLLLINWIKSKTPQ